MSFERCVPFQIVGQLRKGVNSKKKWVGGFKCICRFVFKKYLYTTTSRRYGTEELTAKLNLRELKVLCRNGSLSESETFSRALANKAEKVVLLAEGGDEAEADAHALVGLLAVEGAITGAKAEEESEDAAGGAGAGAGPEVIVEVSRSSSSKLLKRVYSSSAGTTESVEKMTDKILAHCFRQNGLVDVYRKLMRHTDTIINLRSYPELEGLPYGTLRRGFCAENAVVVGLIRSDGEVDFHPGDDARLESNDKVMIIAQKHSFRRPPRELLVGLCTS